MIRQKSHRRDFLKQAASLGLALGAPRQAIHAAVNQTGDPEWRNKQPEHLDPSEPERLGGNFQSLGSNPPFVKTCRSPARKSISSRRDQVRALGRHSS
jgi:hypothetical protein